MSENATEWPVGAEITPIGYQGPARHTYTAACDGFHESQACPAAPNPGSDEALAIGCKCPVLDNGHGRVPPEGRVYVVGCPVHMPDGGHQ